MQQCKTKVNICFYCCAVYQEQISRQGKIDPITEHIKYIKYKAQV